MKKFIYFVVMIMFAAGMTGCIEDPDKGGALTDGEIHTPWTSVDILVGESVQIKASLGRETFQWKSENPSIATVTQDGLVAGLNLGSTRIVISVGNISKTVSINVRGRSVLSTVQFGNGVLIRYGDEKSHVLVREELSYKDYNGAEHKVRVLLDQDSVFLPACYSELLDVSVYMVGSDTVRSEPMALTVQHVNSGVRLYNRSIVYARNFDYGTEGWYDLDPQNRLGGNARDMIGDYNCGVDIGPSGAVEVSAGEWLQYTVAAEDGYYYLDLEVAVDIDNGVDMAIEIDGQRTDYHYDRTTTPGAVTLAYAWYYEDTQAGVIPDVYLSKGQHTIKLIFLNGDFHLRAFDLKSTNLKAPQLEIRLSLDSIRVHDAKDFDLGGEGVGYHDNTPGNSSNIYDYRDALGDFYCGVDYESSGNVCGPNPGEWMRYTLNVLEEGDYYFDMNATVGGPRYRYTYSLQLDRDPKVTYTLLGNSSWSEYDWHYHSRAIEACPKLHLTAGQHRLKLWWEESDGINLRQLKFTPAPLFEQRGIRLVTRFGNGTLIRWTDCWQFPYSITYTDVNNQQKTMDIPMDLNIGNLLLTDFKSGLSYINKNGGSRIDFPDSDIKDISRKVVGDETCVIWATEFDYGVESGDARFDADFQNRGSNRYRILLGDVFGGMVDMGGSGTDPANYNIGWINVGEWLEYTVDVENTGYYTFDALITHGNSTGAYSLDVNDVKGKTYQYVRTSGWLWHYETNPTLARPRLYLTRGKNRIRYNIKGTGYDIRAISLKYYGTVAPIEPPDGFAYATIFGNGLSYAFKDNVEKNYTLTYTNINNQTVTMSIPQSDESFMISDYKSDLSAVAAGYSTVFTPEIKSIRHTISATNPTIIPIVDYDYGGPEVGFHDESGRASTSSYRGLLGDNSAGVDIEGSDEPTNMNIGYVANGEWLQYTLHAEAAGDYAFDFNISVNNVDAKYALTVNGVKTEDYSLGHHNTGGWGNYYWFHRHWEETRPVVHLNEGANTVRIHIIGGNYNMKSFRFDNVLSLPYMTTGWTAASRNGNHNWESASGLPGAVLDGDQRTGWHSSNAELPQCLVVDMKETKAIDHLCLLYMFNGITTNKWVYLKDVKVYLTDTPDVVPDIEQASWGAAVADVTIDLFSASNNGKDAGSEVTRIDLASGSSGRYLILYFPNSRSGNYISFMELEVYQ